MGEINLEKQEIDAIKNIDERELSALIDDAIRRKAASDLPRPALQQCGPYVASKLNTFERALVSYREAKSAKKMEETHWYATKTGGDVLFAVSQMKRRMEEEERQRLLWYVDDRIFWPHYFTSELTVTVSYRWRKSVQEDWTDGRITFRHKFVAKPDFHVAQPKRKPSRAKLQEKHEMELESAWSRLMKDALYALRDYFREGGDGAKIPKEFQVVPGESGLLNNFSTRFWLHNTATS